MFASVTNDNRDRLIREEREQAYNGGSAATAYDYRYGYDQLGNRRWRIDAATSERPAYYYTYVYDTDFDPDELDWPTRNNRLLQYEIRKDSSSGDLLRTVSYTYYKTGHASNITVKDWYVDSSTTPGSAADYDWYHDLALYYFSSGSLRLAMSDKWKLDGEGAPTNYTSLTAREFRYDGIGIARYLAVDYDTNNEPTDPGEWTLVGSPMLTDNAGSTPLTDSSIAYSSSYSATAETRYFAGDGRQSLGSGGSVEDLRYFHGDLIDSRVMATDDSASAVATTAYTAFGEAVPPIGSPPRPANPTTLDTRYQYAGSWGYEADMLDLIAPNTNLAAIRLRHVGARWYQAEIGRFVQRDPIGIEGGISVYAYCNNQPPNLVDPTGFQAVYGPRTFPAVPPELTPPRFSGIPNTPITDPRRGGPAEHPVRGFLRNLFCVELPPAPPPKRTRCPICIGNAKCPGHWVASPPLPPRPPRPVGTPLGEPNPGGPRVPLPPKRLDM